MAAKTTAPKSNVRVACECSKYEVLVNVRENSAGDDLTWDSQYDTGCKGRTTTNVFAQGHDAKLKSFLIKAELAGHDVTRVGDGGVNEIAGAFTFGDRFGFGPMVRHAVALAEIARERKANKKAAKKQVEAPIKPVMVVAKVGRWTYKGQLVNGEFFYTDKQGRDLATTKYVVI